MSLNNNSSSRRHLVQSVNDFDVAVTTSEEMVLTESFDDEGPQQSKKNSSDNDMNEEETTNPTYLGEVNEATEDGIFDLSRALAAAEEEEEEVVFEAQDDDDSPVVIPTAATTTTTEQQQKEQRDDAVDSSSAVAADDREVAIEGEGKANDDDSEQTQDDDDNNNKGDAGSQSVNHIVVSNNDDDDESSPHDSYLQFLPLSLGVRAGSYRRSTTANSNNNEDCNATTTTTESDILSPSSVSSVVDSVLDDLEQQKEARSAANARMQSQYQDRSMIHATEEGIAELVFTLHTYAKDGIVVVNNPQGRDELLQRVQDFHRARFLRREYCASHEETTKRSYGIYGLFQYVTELRLDLEWTEDATWRRLNLKESFPWMDFQRVHKRKYRQPYFCYLLFAIWTLMLALSFAFNDFKFAPMSENPFYGPPINILRELGAVDRDLIVEEHQWYRLVTSLVLHAGLLHYMINVMLMIFMGSAVEQAHGFDGTVLIFLVSGIGGNIISALFLGESISAGASGGLLGLLGVCVADICTHWDLLTLKNYRDPNDPAHKGFNYKLVLFGIAVQVVLYFIIGLAPVVDNYCHIGGLFYGICLTVPILKWLGDGSGFFSSGNNHINHSTGKGPHPYAHEANERNRRQQTACHLFCASVSIFVLVASTLLLAKGQKGEIACTNCRYFSCVPFPWWDDDSSNRWWNCDDCDFAALKADVLYRGNVTTLVNMTCPNEDVVTIDLFAPDVDKDEIRKDLGGYCRLYCES